MRNLIRGGVRWEALLATLMLMALFAGARLSPFFLTVDNLLEQTRSSVVLGLLALGLACVVITGEIDLSGESILAISAVLLGLMWQAGVPLWMAALSAVLVAAGFGAVNGILVAVLRLPSLVVTLGTYIALRGVAYVLLADQPITGFPNAFLALGNGNALGSNVPEALLVLLAAGLIVGVAVHLTVWGRWLFAIGSSRDTARLSGVPVTGAILSSFVLSGGLAGLAGVMLAARFASVRADMATGILLSVLTVVLLGGVSIFGGSGRILGVVLSLGLVGLIQNGMSLANLPAETQQLVVGTLLIAAVLAPRLVTSVDDRLLARRADASALQLRSELGLSSSATPYAHRVQPMLTGAAASPDPERDAAKEEPTGV